MAEIATEEPIRVRHLSEMTAQRDALTVPQEIEMLARGMGALMRQHGVAKIEVIQSLTNKLSSRVYINTVDGAVYTYENGKLLEVKPNG